MTNLQEISLLDASEIASRTAAGTVHQMRAFATAAFAAGCGEHDRHQQAGVTIITNCVTTTCARNRRTIAAGAPQSP